MDVRMTLPARRCLSLFALLLGAGCAQLDPSTGELADATAPTAMNVDNPPKNTRLSLAPAVRRG